MGSLIAAGIMAVIGGTAALIGSSMRDDRAYLQAEREKERPEANYKLNKKKAEDDFKKAKEEAERNAQKAELEADLTDKSLDITEQGLSADFNAAIDQLYLGQQSDTYNWNAQSMQTGSAEGASYAGLAGSGVRAGSSLSDAVLMESATNAAQLQFSQDAKRKSDNNNLAGVLSNLAGNRWNIQSNRIGADLTRNDADYLRNSYLEGGNNWNLYQNQLNKIESDYHYNYEAIKFEQNQHTGINKFMNGLTSFFGGAAQGGQTGYKLGNTIYNANSYTKTIGGKN